MCPKNHRPDADTSAAESILENPQQSPSPPNGETTTSPPEPDGSRSPCSRMAHSPSNHTIQCSPNPTAKLVPIHLVDVPIPANGRANIDQDNVRALARSIQRLGLLNPITVRATPTGYALIAGLHRLLATRTLNTSTIAVTIVVADDAAAAETRLAENAARVALSPCEEATQLRQLLDQGDHDVDDLAALTGHSRDWVDSRLEILDYPPSLETAVGTGKISMAAARSLAQIHDHAQREEMIYQAATHGVNAKTAAQWLMVSRLPERAENEMSEFKRQTENTGIETTTTAECFVCRNRHELHNTVAARVCKDCLSQIEISAARQPQAPTPETLPARGTDCQTNQYDGATSTAPSRDETNQAQPPGSRPY